MENKHLYILWTNADPVTSENMILMYSTNALLNGWWDRITVIIWGATQKLVLENKAVKLKMEIAEQAGVEFSACLTCAINLGTRKALEDRNIEVIRWGEKLTGIMQNGEHLLTV